MLILVGVSINVLVGENGLIGKAKNVAIKANQVGEEDQGKINSLISQLQNFTSDDSTGGNQGEDTTSPIVSIRVVTITENSIQISVNATDTGSGLAENETYKYYINNELKTADTNNGYTFTGLTENTSYIIKVEVYDKAGNKGEDSRTVNTTNKPDTTPPEVSINVGTVTENSIQITVQATETESGLVENETYKYYINNEFKIADTNNSYTFTGLTENTSYTIKVEVYDKAGNKGENSTTAKTLERTWVVADEIPATEYGQIVSNYKCSSAGVNTWRIFYAGDADGDGTSNIYLIADDYIASNYAPKGAGGSSVNSDKTYQIGMETLIKDYPSGTAWINTNSKAKGLLGNWISSYPSGANNNMKAVAYMMDTNVWSVYAGDDAEYAMGGPTIELFVKSYNITHPTKTIEYTVKNQYGYGVRWKGSSSYADNIDGLSTDINGIYIKVDKSNAEGAWIASPSSGNHFLQTKGYNLMHADYDAQLYYDGYAAGFKYGFRPIVCLKSEVQLEKQENGNYIIK